MILTYLNKVKQRLLSKDKKNTLHFKKAEHVYDLIIYDDAFPHPASGFRTEEFKHLLEKFENSKIILSAKAYSMLNLPAELHAEHVTRFIAVNPLMDGKTEFLNGKININCRLFYCVFLNNIFENIDWLEDNNISFVFTLYPGGGFSTSDPDSLLKLKRIFSSRCFRKVIVTQQRTYLFLAENNFCSHKDMVFIFGVVVPQQSIPFSKTILKKYFPAGKKYFDICFCAMKYTKFGEDKGYPLFVSFMHNIASRYPFTRFHIIGGFDEHTIDVSAIGDKIKFYGIQDFENLKTIFTETDLIISPNQPGKLGKGAFDGFPLGTVIEAALNEVVVMLTDPFSENKYFDDGKELVIIDNDVNDMIAKFEELVADPGRFYSIARNGKLKFQQIYSNKNQLAPRIELLESIIHS